MRRWRRLLCALSTLVTAQANPPSARADEGADLASLELSWNAPEACPSREAVLAELSRALGDTRSNEKVHARARVRRDTSGSFVLSLGIRSGKLDSERTVKDPSCAVVTEAAVVMLVLAIDPARGLRRDPLGPSAEPEPERPEPAPSDLTPPPTPTGPRSAEEAARAIPASVPAYVPRAPRGRRFTLGLSIGPNADFGTFGRPAMGARAGVYASIFEKLRVDVGLLTWMPVQITLEDRPAYGIRVSAVGAATRGCFLPISRGATQVGACAGLDFTEARATGFGTRQSRSDEARWFGIGAGVIGRERLSQNIHLTGTVYANFPLEGPQYGVQIREAARRVHRVSFGVRVTFAIEVAVF